ncbi:phosphoglycerate kinase [bacterium]|nr:phosphoglycerate kinase [bacterium]
MKTIKQADIKNKRILLRCDFNVEIKNGKIVDDFRIRKALPTIKYLLENNNQIVIISHLDRPKPKRSFLFGDRKHSLKPVAKRLSELLQTRVEFINDFNGFFAKRKLKKFVPKRIFFLENIRFYQGEEKNDEKFAQMLAELGDVYVNDAFGASHREHASIVSLPKLKPSFAGLLFEEEIVNLSPLIKNPQRPLVLVLGGAKAKTKIPLIGELLKLVDHILIGGKIANIILAGKGYSVGKFIMDPQIKEAISEINLTSPKVHLPVDGVVSLKEIDKEYIHIAAMGKIRREEECFDIGPETVGIFSEILKEAKTVVWNGPLGLVEEKEFQEGSKRIAQAIIRDGSKSIIGGGDTIKFLDEQKWLDYFDFVSTGGGAMLEYLAYKTLPGIEALNK